MKKKLLNKIITVSVILLFNLVITYGLIHTLVLSKLVIIEKNQTLNHQIDLSEGEIILQENSTVNGDLNLTKGSININNKSIIKGNITIKEGNLIIGDDVHISGNVTLNKGKIHLGESSIIEGSVKAEDNALEKHTTAQIKGEKPFVYTTYNLPPVLKYFDLLPETHKKALGFIFLTKQNSLARANHDLQPEDYYQAIYHYNNGQLETIDLKSPEVANFLKKAEKFYTDLPERMLGTHDVGATTKNYAINKKNADIYIPFDSSSQILIHEMGHVQDFQGNYCDLNPKLYPFQKDKAISEYGATHPGEDFAEAYAYYVLHYDTFQSLIKQDPDYQKKYDYIKQIFLSKEYGTKTIQS